MIYREYNETALRMGADALSLLGHRRYAVHRALKTFRKHDEEMLHELAGSHHENTTFLKNVKRKSKDMEKLILDDMESIGKDKDLGWDASSLKKEFLPIIKELQSKT